MKKRFSILFLLAAATLLCACTGTKAAVTVVKDGERLIEEAQTVQVSASGTEQTQNAPDADNSAYTASFHGTTDAFTVNVDAAPELPDTDALPVVRVSAGEFDQQTADRFFQLLCGGTDMYTRDQLMTKSVLDQEIVKTNKMIENGEDTDGYLRNTYLMELQKRYEKASDQPGMPAGSVIYQQETTQGLVWNSFEVYSGYPDGANWSGKTFWAQTNRVQTSSAEVGAQTSSSLNYSDLSIYPAYEPAVTAVVTGQASAPEGSGLTMTPIQAQRQAEDLLSQAGVADMRVSAVYLAANLYTLTPGSDPDPRWTTDPKLAKYTYIVSFQRVVNGVAVTNPGVSIAGSGVGEDGSAEWWYERLEIQLNENGISRFYWVAPHTVEKVEVEQSNLLPFGEVKDLFQTMVQVKYEPMVLEKDTYHISSMTLDINGITLSLQRVREGDCVTEGLFIPVWNFWGTQTIVYEDGTTVVRDSVNDDTYPVSLLTINAVDGSVIDIQKGR